uniref:uncharacterized protein si:ch211-214j8.12 n=1 Tax=Doryrhamphus excisus TaxID=161450 RepID=UPI0025AE4B57|nr:uncharacterized protein si:ch211-214j8.12 [Doryrhamphus excisus]
MPLFRGDHAMKPQPKWRKLGRRRITDDEPVPSLTQLCLLSLADNMKEVWVKDYADKYLDHYSFRHIMGPFNLLSGDLVEELTQLLCTRKQLSRAALHLLLVPQLRGLSLERCPGLVTSSLCAHISARCQALHRLSLSGAQQMPSKVLSDALYCLPALRSLSLAGTPCDSAVIRTITLRCPLLRHLDVSQCHFLPPSALLLLGGFCPSSNCVSSSTSVSGLPLCSLFAVDIGFGDSAMVAAYLLLSLPHLERVAMEGLSQAFLLIQNRHFALADEISTQEGLPRLEDVWKNAWSKRKMETEEDNHTLLDSDASESEDEAATCSYSLANDEHLTLHIRDVKAITCDCLVSLGCLCPNINSLSVIIEEENGGQFQASILATGLQPWSGQLWSLSVQHQGPLQDLLPALQVAGASLVSLTLEGVRTHPRSLLEIIRICTRLEELVICAEPPTTLANEVEDVVQRNERDLPCLPNLSSLALNYSYEHSQMMPLICGSPSLMKVIMCLLTGSPLLEKLSLVSLPCPLNGILQCVLDFNKFSASANCVPKPLGRLQRLNLQRTNVKMKTVNNIMQRSKRLKYVDVSHCWQISQQEWSYCKKSSTVEVVWV